MKALGGNTMCVGVEERIRRRVNVMQEQFDLLPSFVYQKAILDCNTHRKSAFVYPFSASSSFSFDAT